MKERFFRCIDHCVPGFSILALCCVVIESLQGFREALPLQLDPPGPCPNPKPRVCIKPAPGTAEQFKSFLRRPAFGGAFKDGKVAGEFVSGIRNGVLHDAETRRWLIRRDRPAGKIVESEEGGLVLNRTLFYGAVRKQFDMYLQDLHDPVNQGLRTRFRNKMNELCADKK